MSGPEHSCGLDDAAAGPDELAGLMSSKDHPHTATRHGDHWVVSWLPGRKLRRQEAIAAMTLAWQVAMDASITGPHWPGIVADAGELGMSGSDAVAALLGLQVPKARAGER